VRSYHQDVRLEDGFDRLEEYRAQAIRIWGTGFTELEVNTTEAGYGHNPKIRHLTFKCRCEITWASDNAMTWWAKPCLHHVKLSPLVDVIVHSQGGGSPVRVRKHDLDRSTPWGTWAVFADTGDLFASNVDSSG
jgi:hypothetical protein